MVIGEKNYLSVNRFAFQTNIKVQNEIYKHAHTHTQTQKHAQNIHKTYTQEPTQEHAQKPAHIWDMLLCLKRSFLSFLSPSSTLSGKQY